MRPRPLERAEVGRVTDGYYASEPGELYGFFQFKLDAKGPRFTVICSAGDEAIGVPWEHVSVSTPRRCPTWEEMCKIKDLFWRPDEWVVQFHPPESANVSNHAYCLHMWRPVHAEMPLPPSIAVGTKELGELDTDEKRRAAFAAQLAAERAYGRQ